MKKTFFTLLSFFLLIICKQIFAQEYQITNVPVSQYSIDRYANEIYYQHEFTEEVFKTNSKGSYHILTEFTSVPQFANNSHTAAYVDIHQSNSDLYLYDFEKDTSYFLINTQYFGSNLLFSPSDNKILRSGEVQVYIVYYSFEDSSFHDTGVTIFPWVMEWLTDTTIIYASLEKEILVLNINNLSFDTLVVLPDTVILRGLAHNANINAFAYSQEYYYTVGNSLINMYYLSNGVDTTVYNFLEDGPSLGGFTIFIRSLTWERNTNKLGFIGEVVLNPFSFVYAFDYSSSKTYQYSNWDNGDGVKYNLQWLNKDTVIYSDYSDGRQLFGLDVTEPVSISEKLYEVIDEFDIKIYPNPFNSSAKIVVYIPSPGDLTLELFNCLGESIGRKDFGYASEGKLTLDLNEIQNLRNIASGVYLIRTSFISYEYSNNKTIKVIYLK